MKRFIVAALLALSTLFPLCAHALGPVRTYDVGFSVAAGQVFNYRVVHNLGYVPIVQAVTGGSTLNSYVWRVTTTETWVKIQNTSPLNQSGTFRVYLY